MARGFGSTRGVGITDVITTTLNTNSTLRSYFIRQKWNGSAVSTQSVWSDSGGSNDDYVFILPASSLLIFERGWSTLPGQWSVPVPTTNIWSSYGISYDGSSSANNPLIYQDGISVSVTEESPPSGTLIGITTNYLIGNSASNNAAYNGDLAEFAIWDAILTPDEFAALGAGYSPLFIRPASLVEYVPMLGPNVSRKRAAPTITGTAIQSHPNTIMPSQPLFGRETLLSTQFVGVESLNASFSRVIRPIAY